MSRSPFARLKSYYPAYRRSILRGLVFVVLTSALYPTVPLIIKYAVDSLEDGGNHPFPFDLFIRLAGAAGSLPRTLAIYAAAIVAVTLVQGVFRFLMRYTITGASRRFERDLRNEIFAHLQLLPSPWYQTAKTGDLMARMTNDINAVRMLMGPGYMYLTSTLITFVIAVSFMITVSPQLTLYTFVPLVLIAVATRMLSREIHRRSERVQRHFSMVSERVQENLSGIRVVKSYCRESSEIDRFSDLIDRNMEVNLSLARIQSLFMPMLFSLVIGSHLVVLWDGGRRILAGSLGYGDFIAFNVILGILVWPMVSLGWVVSLYQQGKASMTRINHILESEPQRSEGAGPGLPRGRRLQGEVEFRGLSFAYNGTEVLRDIDLRIPAGSTLAVVGPVGSGKSTLANLIPRLFEAPPGTLLLDGRPVGEYPLSVLRGAVGHVPQDSFLFSDSIEANIAFGAPDSDFAAVQRAAEISQISADVEGFPEGYDTLVGERGVMLSGGQKQRVAVARAVLLVPSILILDDALSAVDTYTEEQILQQLRGFMKGRTTLIIAQRLSTIKDADRIVVLVDGGIEESGSHEQLMDLGGVYAEMYRLQLLQAEIDHSD
jgi:ATP-binding cassette subfamily B multidrug efflux pump